MGHYDKYYENEECKQTIRQESIQLKLEELNKELKESFRRSRPTLAEEDNLYALKNYIDKRFDMLMELMVK